MQSSVLSHILMCIRQPYSSCYKGLSEVLRHLNMIQHSCQIIFLQKYGWQMLTYYLKCYWYCCLWDYRRKLQQYEWMNGEGCRRTILICPSALCQTLIVGLSVHAGADDVFACLAPGIKVLKHRQQQVALLGNNQSLLSQMGTPKANKSKTQSRQRMHLPMWGRSCLQFCSGGSISDTAVSVNMAKVTRLW